MGKSPRPRRGPKLGELGVVPNADVIIDRGRIIAVGSSLSIPPGSKVLEADGRVLMPSFVDCHTHACWAGDRIGEWEQRLRGASYLDILKSGGGIMATVSAVRQTSQDALAKSLGQRLVSVLRCGTTTVEVKSGYGLSTDDELKMLRSIAAADEGFPGTVVPTALLGHAIDPDDAQYVERTVRETLPAVHEEFPGVAVDVYCEQGAWSLKDAMWLLQAAKELGHPVRLHADQFNSLGAVRQAVELGAVSVDHLEASSAEDRAALAASDTFAVLLPCSGFHVDGRYAAGRELVDQGGLVALATNYNPGSAPCPSMPMAIALAVRHCGLTPAEAIAAATVNAASLLGLTDRGTVQPGQRADLVLLRHRDERSLAYEFGDPAISALICAGEVLFGRVH